MKKLVAGFTTALLAIGLAAVGVAAPASAHDSTLSGTAVCETDGTYTVTWTYNATNVPNGQEAETKVMTTSPSGTVLSGTDGVLKGGQLYLSVWTDHKVNVPGAPVRTGNWTATFTQSGVPGTSTSAGVMVQTDWKDGASQDPTGKVVLTGDCSIPKEKDASAAVSVTPATCDVPQKLVLADIKNATWGTPSLTTGPGTYEVTATAKDGHLFSDGKSTKDFTGVLTGKARASSGDCQQEVPKDASAAVATTAPTCDVAETLVLSTPTNATWGTPTISTGPGTYSVTATAKSGHQFSDGKTTKVFTGTLAGKSTAAVCDAPPPACIPNSDVSYTYNPATNSGVVTVKNTVTKSGELCEPLYVTATSWKYVTENTWPQKLDVVQQLPVIKTPGDYPYAAAVGCGQGDIYASRTESPSPTPVLTAPGTPFNETFLSGMGFSGPSPTYVQQPNGCNSVVPVAPTATKITECNTDGSLVIPANTDQVTYTLVGNGKTGLNTVTAEAISPAVLKDYPAGGWTFDLGERYECPTVLADAVAIPQVCVEGDPSNPTSGQIEVALNDHVVYSIDGVVTTTEFTDVEPGEHVVTAVADAGYTLEGPSSFTLTVDSELCTLATWEAKVTSADQSCSTDNLNSGYLTLYFPADLPTAIQYTIDGKVYTSDDAATVKVKKSPGTYTAVATVTDPVDSIVGKSSFTATIDEAADAPCTDLTTLALTDGGGANTLASTGFTATAGLLFSGALLFLGAAAIYMRRRFGAKA